MHCPRCGQKQISVEVKFCSRCGFRMPVVARLLENDGSLPELEQQSRSGIFTRRNGVVFTILWFIFWLMMLPAFFGILDAEFPAAFSAVFGLFSSLMLLVISIAFLPKKSHRAEIDLPPARFRSTLENNPVPKQIESRPSEPATDYVSPASVWREPDKVPLSEPGSVTETTTKLLKKDE